MSETVGIVLRPLLDGTLAQKENQDKLELFKERNEFITALEARIKECDWISLSDGTTYEKTFTPTKKYV